MRGYLAVLAIMALVPCADRAAGAADDRPHKPRLDLRASPRMAFSPVEILVIGELKGGADIEEFYCPALVWDWGDGTRSAHEADCSPYHDGAALDRLFTARHAFRRPGKYEVHLYLVRGGQTLTAARVPVMVYGHPELGSDY